METYKEKYKPIRFPRDEQKHNHTIEWWYFNGNLKDKNGKIFSYMNCLFAAKPDKLDIPFLKNNFIKEIFFSHYLLSDNKKWIAKGTNPLCAMDRNSFKKPLLWANYDNSCLIEETEPFKYRIVNDVIDLNMESRKDPLLLNKKGFLDLGLKTTYYYSITRLKTKGLVRVRGKWIAVEGVSWMDHQWAQAPSIEEDQWKWFSIQLDNKIDLVCFVYGKKIKTYHASMIGEKGKTDFTNKILITEGKNKYKSKETGNTYQLEYNINMPEFKLNLNIKPLKKEQEMNFGPINYWEGGTSVKGTFNGKKVGGLGFCELLLPFNRNLKIKMKPIKTVLKEISDLSTKSIYYLNNKIQNK